MAKVSNKAFQQEFKQAVTYAQQENIAQLVEALAAVDENAVFARLEVIQDNRNLEAAIEISEDAELSALCEISCAKSGQPIACIELKEMQTLIAINGVERVKYMLRQRAITSISHKWIFTDERALDNLAEHDPLGYFIFAASAIVRAYQPGFSKHENQFDNDDTEAHYRFIASKRALWDYLQSVPLDAIVRGNEIMRRYLSFISTSHADHVVKFSEFNLACITVDTFINEVQDAIAKVIWHEFKNGRIKSHIDYADVVDLKSLYKGHSNFRRQGNIGKMGETDLIMHQLRDLMDTAKFAEYQQSKKPWELRELQAKAKPQNVHMQQGPIVLKRAEVQDTDKKPLKVSFATLLRASREKRQAKPE